MLHWSTVLRYVSTATVVHTLADDVAAVRGAFWCQRLMTMCARYACWPWALLNLLRGTSHVLEMRAFSSAEVSAPVGNVGCNGLPFARQPYFVTRLVCRDQNATIPFPSPCPARPTRSYSNPPSRPTNSIQFIAQSIPPSPLARSPISPL